MVYRKAFGAPPAEVNGGEVPERGPGHSGPILWPNLTAQQRKVAQHLVNGWENEAIARDLNVKVRTVKAIMHRMFRKYKVTSGIKRVKLAVLLYRESHHG